MPRVPDEWVVVTVDAIVRLRKHTEVDVLLMDVEVPTAGVVLSFDVSGSWAEAVFEGFREHEAQCSIVPGLADYTGPEGHDSRGRSCAPGNSFPARDSKRDEKKRAARKKS